MFDTEVDDIADEVMDEVDAVMQATREEEERKKQNAIMDEVNAVMQATREEERKNRMQND